MATNIKKSLIDPRIHCSFSHLKSLQSRARKLNFLPKQKSKSVLSGHHQSRIRGRGLSFEELRNYRVGDDIRTIDWRVTARTGKPHVRVYAEEKDRSALLLIDQRVNMFFGSQLNMKSVTAAEAAAICAYRIFAQGDRVGAVLFNDEQMQSFKPSKKPQALEELVKSISDYNMALNCNAHIAQQTRHLNEPLEAATRLVSHDQLIIVISDFDAVDEHTEQKLSQMAAHNDVILCLVSDPLISSLPNDLQLAVSNGEKQLNLDTSRGDTKQQLQTAFMSREQQIRNWQNRFGLTVIDLNTKQDTLQQFHHAFAIGR
ncbi:DUF58 domain-containing protein [Pseudoalteromonas haloplanktis]|uniref:DUF58 domain-containing protein n=1 Tax=Pseudoalteromonas haloplanktis TaxID=228 RepID=A0ABU1BHE7_PSEHA|nr:DUF58 domain-containing protein [Pseudoalteromonas haloplanktis]MDQ9093181.1 DUF58 domain-containing protein [Pseudoalteromonas haloplanktis]